MIRYHPAMPDRIRERLVTAGHSHLAHLWHVPPSAVALPARRSRVLWPNAIALHITALLLCLLCGCTFIDCAPTAPLTPAAQPSAQLAAAGIHYWLVTRQEPRPLRIHHLQVDLRNPHVELAPVLAADPDGTGPATAQLTSPLLLAQRASALALVNANPWQGIPDAAGKRSTNWHEGMPVQILGLAAAHGDLRNAPVDPAYCSVWIDRAGKPHIGCPGNIAAVRDGIAGFLQLVRDGKVIRPPGGPIHPRTALGMDASGRKLYLVVVDGRRPGYSEGMSYFELATYMRELGCQDAVNLDGGGSSIMLMSTGQGNYRIMNDPSTKLAGLSLPRPIPIALALRNRPAQVPATAPTP